MKIAKQILAGSFTLILLLAISETAIHSAMHHGDEPDHGHIHHCEDHDHGMEDESSICSHEHQCELCILIQAATNYLPPANADSEFASTAEVETVRITSYLIVGVSSAFSPRGPPRI